ncbi:arsenate reductase family protein [Brevibacillus daliensis]|uniref:arsenate reductase family protein n=1 Tax=Brevibacillus daliensis TaxID=2892995 RepID=UPI001E52E3D6|nr:arsenate reductase family protein [Brevibacillus daliensis]
MTMKAYLYNKCGTCQKAKKWLEKEGISFEEIPIVEQPPTKEELRQIWQQSGLDIKKMFNTSGQVYREQGVKDKLPGMSEDEMLELLATDGKLIKRPILTDGKKATVGFKEDNMQDVWGK